MAKTETCDYCGSERLRAWQGAAHWCGSDRCNQRHEWATYEPNFRLFYCPTPLQQLIAWLLHWPFLWLILLLPAAWLVDWCVEKRGPVLGRFLLWVYQRSYWLDERAAGRI